MRIQVRHDKNLMAFEKLRLHN